jgi:hypothetical protein
MAGRNVQIRADPFFRLGQTSTSKRLVVGDLNGLKKPNVAIARS